jgi:hypothetical protein
MKCIAGIGKLCFTNYNLGYAFANGIFALAEGLDMFRLDPIATGWRMIPSSICPLQKELWLDGCLGVEPRRVGNALAEGLSDLGGGGDYSG